MEEIKEGITTYFGEDFLQKQNREESYDMLENFISKSHENWKSTPDTDIISKAFAEEIKKHTTKQIGFLLLHSGYIPEFYPHDSSQETLYSKLVEVLVNEWAVRIGFTDSSIQTQKSSREDVTLLKGKDIIVCDAKSYRLGRSQAAPNVKDTLKKADFSKWLDNYDNEHQKKGGLVTFPSLHKWTKKSDAIAYSTDKELPIPILYYEHLSFMMVSDKIDFNSLSYVYDKYDEIFPEPTPMQAEYLKRLTDNLFKDDIDSFHEFSKIANILLREKVEYTINSVNRRLKEGKDSIRKEVEQMPEEDLKNLLVHSEYFRKHYKIIKQLRCITKFRLKD